MLSRRGISLLERERRRRDLSATDLAKRMHVSRSAVTQVERAWIRPSEGFKKRAAVVLGVQVGDLFPELWFLTRGTSASTHVIGPDGRTLAFTSEAAAAEAARSIGGRCEVLGPAPLAWFSLMHGEDEVDVLGRLTVDPEPAQLALKNESPGSEDPGLVTTSAGGVGRHELPTG